MQMSEAKRQAIQGQMIGVIASNLRELRKRGLSAADLLALEKLAILCRKGRGIVRPSDLGRLLGITRQGAHKRLARLTEKGVALRVGRAVMLNVRGLLAMAVDAAKERAARPKPLHWLAKWRASKPCATHTRQTERKGDERGPAATESALIADWRVGDVGLDGRKIVGQRKLGLLFVPVWA